MDEQALLQARFNPKVKAYWTLSGVLIAMFTLVGIPFIPFVALIIWLVSSAMLNAMSAHLLERKLVVKRGVFFVVEKSIPLEKITDVALSQGPLMRVFGLYQLSFETAGQSGAGALVSLIGIEDASEFRESILQQKDNLSLNKTKANDALSSESEPNDLTQLTKSVQNIETMLAQLIAEKAK